MNEYIRIIKRTRWRWCCVISWQCYAGVSLSSALSSSPPWPSVSPTSRAYTATNGDGSRGGRRRECVSHTAGCIRSAFVHDVVAQRTEQCEYTKQKENEENKIPAVCIDETTRGLWRTKSSMGAIARGADATHCAHGGTGQVATKLVERRYGRRAASSANVQ